MDVRRMSLRGPVDFARAMQHVPAIETIEIGPSGGNPDDTYVESLRVLVSTPGFRARSVYINMDVRLVREDAWEYVLNMVLSCRFMTCMRLGYFSSDRLPRQAEAAFNDLIRGSMLRTRPPGMKRLILFNTDIELFLSCIFRPLAQEGAFPQLEDLNCTCCTPTNAEVDELLRDPSLCHLKEFHIVSRNDGISFRQLIRTVLMHPSLRSVGLPFRGGDGLVGWHAEFTKGWVRVLWALLSIRSVPRLGKDSPARGVPLGDFILMIGETLGWDMKTLFGY